MTGHNPPGHKPYVRVPRSVARPNKTHRITHRRLESEISGLAEVNPWFRTPMSGGSEPGGYVRGGYVRQSWNLAFRTPVPVPENDIVHWVLILRGVMSWGFRPALPLTGSSDPGGYVRGVYVRQSTTPHHSKHNCTLLYCVNSRVNSSVCYLSRRDQKGTQ